MQRLARVAIALAILPSISAFPAYHELYYSQRLDHFSPVSNGRWSHRYLLNNDSWDGRGQLPNGCRGPILLYAGNEGPIDGFWVGNGFMIEVLAPRLGGLLLFPEERFYGKSLPFGEESTSWDRLAHLTTAQVLEDYVELVAHIKATTPGAAACPVVAFGGSYGATLAALLRAAHPESVVGALAASSELGYYDVSRWQAHDVSEYTFEEVVIADYTAARPGCWEKIQATTAAIDAAERGSVVQAFHLCDDGVLGPTKSSLFAYALEALPQQDYPYVIGAMPAKPVTWVCDTLLGASDADADAMLAAAGAVVDLALNRNGPDCLANLGLGGPGNTPGDGPGPGAWGWQSCTETLHCFSARGLRNYTFNYSVSADICASVYDGTVSPDTASLAIQFGGYGLADGSAGVKNIIWSQGTLDPWHGWFRNVSAPPAKSEIYHFLMEGSAHHLDLRSPHPADPPDTVAARAAYEKIIAGWIKDAAAQTPLMV